MEKTIAEMQMSLALLSELQPTAPLGGTEARLAHLKDAVHALRTIDLSRLLHLSAATVPTAELRAEAVLEASERAEQLAESRMEELSLPQLVLPTRDLDVAADDDDPRASGSDRPPGVLSRISSGLAEFVRRSSRARVTPRQYSGLGAHGPDSADEPKLAITPRGTAWGAWRLPPPTELPPPSPRQDALPPSSRSKYFHIFGGW